MSASVASQVVVSDLFPRPNSGNATLDLFNQTARIGTDGEFRYAYTQSEVVVLAHTSYRCIDQATLIAAAKHKVFKSVRAYQFDRSIHGFVPIPGTCDPPATPAFPNGDPSLPYFRYDT
jgi:hypothetical protein